MGVMQLILIFVLLLGELACIYLVFHTQQIAKNNADILQNREKEYEAEKGKNLATKEDIEDITKKVEEVKTAVSFSKRKKYEQLAEQEKNLVNILYEATIIFQSSNKLILYLYDTSTREKCDTLVESVNDALTRFYHLCNLTIVSISVEEFERVIGNLTNAVTNLGRNVSIVATDAANLVEQFNKQFNYALHQTNTAQSKQLWMENSLKTKKQMEAMREKPIEGIEQLKTAIDNYCAWLKQLYNKDFFVLKS